MVSMGSRDRVPVPSTPLSRNGEPLRVVGRVPQEIVAPAPRVGGLGGLGGMLAPAGDDGAGLLGNPQLSDFLRSVGQSMLSSPGNTPFQNVPTYLASARKERRATDQRNRTVEWLRETDPEVAGMVDAGMDVSDAYRLAFERKKLAEGPDPTSEMRNFQYAQANPGFADFMSRGSGSGDIDLETIYDEQGREQKGYFSGGEFIPVGGAKSGRSGLTADDKRAIREADDIATSADSAVTLLDRAQKLSDTAYEGAGATGRATIAANVWGSDAATDTIELNNVVTEQALGQLKAIFGGAPTEGERQILLDIQGSANQPKKVRDEIYARARAAAERRAQYNRDRAADLRGGDYYNPGRSSTSVLGSGPAGGALGLDGYSDADLEAIANGQ